MLENYVLVNFIDMELKDGEGNLLKSDGKAERMAMAEDYVTRFKNGEDFDALNNEYRTFYTKLKEDAAKETQGSETPAVTEDLGDTQIQWTPVEGSDAEDDAPDTEETGIVAGEETPEETAAPDEELSSDEDTETEAPAETTVTTTAPAETEAPAETAEQPAPENEISNYPSNKQVVEKDGTYPDADVVAKAFELTVGDVAIVESKDGEHYYVVARLDLNEDENYFTSSKQSLLFEMKSDDYDALIDEWVAAQNYKENPAAVNRYDPTKLFKDS
ncbi:MAG: hypothetical protein J6X85_03375 [Ruminococcus sp.]|nr:hypothetical protein [Ruminococcus sp.]